MKELICITCPKGCRLTVDESDGIKVNGYGCERGIVYARKELTDPTRVLTSTVKAEGGPLARLPVKSDRDVPKPMLRDIVIELEKITAHCPVQCGQVLVENILGTGANIVATRSL